MPPRVAPRTPLQDRIDPDFHRPRGELRTAIETTELRAHWTTTAALVLLAVFLVALPAGFGLVWISTPIGAALLGLAAAALIVSWLLGAS